MSGAGGEWIVTADQMHMLGVEHPEGLGLPRLTRCRECRHHGPGSLALLWCRQLETWAVPEGFCSDGSPGQANGKPSGAGGDGGKPQVARRNARRDGNNI